MSVYTGKRGKGETIIYKRGRIEISWSPPRLRGNKGTYSAMIFRADGSSEMLRGYLSKGEIKKEAKQLF